jgi:hypothetical protein
MSWYAIAARPQITMMIAMVTIVPPVVEEGRIILAIVNDI